MATLCLDSPTWEPRKKRPHKEWLLYVLLLYYNFEDIYFSIFWGIYFLINFRFFIHIALEYAFTIWICFMLYKEYDHVALMRLRFLASKRRHAEQFTVSWTQIFFTVYKRNFCMISIKSKQPHCSFQSSNFWYWKFI